MDGETDENIVDTLLTDSTAVDEGPYRVAATAYVRWYRDLYSEPEHTDDGLSKAWNPERQEYEFAIAGRTEEEELVLRASEYNGGRLDWYNFDRGTGSSLRTPPDDRDTQSVKRRILPTPTTFRGAPRDRWFEFEDATVNLDRIHLERDNPAGVVFLEFALRYSNDWFTVPVDVPVGTVTRVTGLTVRDTFGEVTFIDRYGNVVNGEAPVRSENDTWELFAQTGDDNGGLAVLPTLLGGLVSTPTEEVVFARDELANLAWAIERSVEGPLGDALDRYELTMEEQPATSGPPIAEMPRYQLVVEAPAHWFPLMPTPDRSGENRLRRGLMFGFEDDHAPDHPLGRLLADLELSIYEEEVPREGVTLQRTYQLARWFDGRTLLWTGRTKRFGSGERSVDLGYDALVTPRSDNSTNGDGQ